MSTTGEKVFPVIANTKGGAKKTIGKGGGKKDCCKRSVTRGVKEGPTGSTREGGFQRGGGGVEKRLACDGTGRIGGASEGKLPIESPV